MKIALPQALLRLLMKVMKLTILVAVMGGISTPALAQSPQQSSIPTVRQVDVEIYNVNNEIQNNGTRTKRLIGTKEWVKIDGCKQRSAALHDYLRRLYEYRHNLESEVAAAGRPPWVKSRPSLPFPLPTASSGRPQKSQPSKLAKIKGNWVLPGRKPAVGPGRRWDALLQLIRNPVQTLQVARTTKGSYYLKDSSIDL